MYKDLFVINCILIQKNEDTLINENLYLNQLRHIVNDDQIGQLSTKLFVMVVLDHVNIMLIFTYNTIIIIVDLNIHILIRLLLGFLLMMYLPYIITKISILYEY